MRIQAAEGKGKHPLFVDPAIPQPVHEIFDGCSRPWRHHYQFAFGGGLLRCAYDDCMM